MSKLNKILISVVVVVGLGAFLYSRGTREVETVRIGVLIPLTGRFATFGADMQTALTIAEKDLEESGRVSFELVYEDSAADPKVSINAANKLVRIDHLPIIIGGPGSSANLAVAPLMEETQTIFPVASLTPKLNEAGVYTLKFQQDIDGEVAKMMEYMQQRGHAKVAVLYDSSSDTQTTARDIFTREFIKTGAEVVFVDGFDSKTVSDFRSFITKMKNANSDALYLLAVDRNAGTVVKQARELGFNKPIYGMSALDSYEFLRASDNNAEGIVFTSYPFFCDRTPESKEYCRKFRELLPSAEPTHYGPYSYDILSLIARSIIDHGFSKERLLEDLISTQNYDGISGTISLNSKGNLVDTEYVLKTVKNGKIEPVD